MIEVDEDKSGRTMLVITELPYMVNPDNLIVKIAELADGGRVQGISEVRNETSSRVGQRIVIVLKRDAVARVVLNNLLKHTELQTNFSANMLALVDSVPRTLSIDQFISNWVTHQIDVIRRRTEFRLRKAEERAHIFRGLVKALDALDEVIALIRRSPEVDDARQGLIALLEIDEIQANAILDMQLRRLAALERQKIIDQLAEIELEIADYLDILARPERQRSIVIEELEGIVEKYGDERRSQIIAAEGDLSMEDLIPDEDLVVSITRGGYAKRTRSDQYRTQKRGGKASAAPRCAVTTWSSTSSRRPTTTGCSSSPPPAGSTGPRRTTCPRRPATQGWSRRRPAELPAGREHRPGARDPRLRPGPVPRPRDPLRPGQEDAARGLQQPAPGRRHRDQLPRGGRRADRRRAGQRRGPHPPGQPQGSGDPLPGRQRPAATDGPRHLRRHRHEVP